MMVTMLKSKIHRAAITGSNLHYEGSISIDPELYKAAGMHE
ncbi:MAG: aspartate 1-decarboxylase, partial [Spirochaetales bacterium]|nr:aspartate 1-decarboxylase [Spirochaetales bacterium]